MQGGNILGKTTHHLMIQNHLPGRSNVLDMGYPGRFSEQENKYIGYGLGLASYIGNQDQVERFGWGGAASTYYWVDPNEEIIGILMTQLLPSTAYPLRSQLVNMVNSSIV